MNCYLECKNYLKTRKDSDLGDIAKVGTCANCLYWQTGIGRPDFQYSDCTCNTTMLKATDGGRRMDTQGYNEIRDCLKTGSNCGVMYSNWTNTPAMPPQIPSEVPLCSKRFIGNQGTSYPGVF